MRARTAFAVVLVSGFACLGVPSAAADELLPTPAATSEGGAQAVETVTAPTPEPADTQTTEATPPEAQESVPPADGPAEPTGDETTATAEGAAGEPTEPADQPGEEPDGTQTGEGADADGLAESAGAAQPHEIAAAEEEPLSQAPAGPVLDPLASIGDLDCTGVTVPVTLDNSRSTGTVRFVVQAVDDYEDWETGQFLYEQEFDLAAGATEVVRVPVTEVSFVSIFALAFGPSGPELGYAGMKVNCALAEPRASIGDVTCNDFTVPVTLNNSRSLTETTFWVSAPSDEEESEERFAVPAGATRVVQVAVTEDSFVDMFVGFRNESGESIFLTEEDIFVHCVPRQGLTTATVGEFECTTRTIPITVDNSEVSSTRVWVITESIDFFEDDFFSNEDEIFDVAPRTTQVLRARGPASNQWVRVSVFNVDEPQTPTDNWLLTSRDIRISCPGTAARPTVAVKGTKLADTGGLNLAIPLLGFALIGSGSLLLTLTGRRCRQ